MAAEKHLSQGRRGRLAVIPAPRNPYSLVLVPLLICFLGYIAFVASGPFPIRIVGFKLDILFAAGLAILSLAYLPRVATGYPAMVPAAVGLFLLATFPSVLISAEVEYSLSAWTITFGYALVTLLAPFAIHARLPRYRTFLFVAAILVALALIYLYFVLGFGTAARLALALAARGRGDIWTEESGWVDPNHTAIGLAMSAVIYLPNLQRRGPPWLHPIVKRTGELMGISIILIAAIMLLSRTSVLSFGAGIAGGFAVVWLFGDRKSRTSTAKAARMVAVLLLITAIGAIAIAPDQLLNLYERFSGAIELAQQPTQRLGILARSWGFYWQSPLTIFFGAGYFVTNPHNEYLRFLTSSGTLGFAAFFILIAVFYRALCWTHGRNPSYLFYQNALFLYLFTSIQTYGHTKTLWVPLMFLLANYLEDRRGFSRPAVPGRLRWGGPRRQSGPMADVARIEPDLG